MKNTTRSQFKSVKPRIWSPESSERNDPRIDMFYTTGGGVLGIVARGRFETWPLRWRRSVMLYELEAVQRNQKAEKECDFFAVVHVTLE